MGDERRDGALGPAYRGGSVLPRVKHVTPVTVVLKCRQLVFLGASRERARVVATGCYLWWLSDTCSAGMSSITTGEKAPFFMNMVVHSVRR